LLSTRTTTQPATSRRLKEPSMQHEQTERAGTTPSAGTTQSTGPAPSAGARQSVNVGSAERIASIVLGSGLLTFGLIRRSRAGWGLAATGATLLYRGIGGNCAVYRALGINRAADADGRRGNLGVKIERELSIEEPAEKLYRFWRDFRNLPTIMPNVESVTVLSDTRSHWVVKGPMGTKLEWDALVINDKPNELIAWRTEGTRVESAGSVRFESRPDGSTLVRVALQYSPPGGEVAHMISTLFGEDPGARIDEDLARLKEAMGRAHEDRDGLQPASANTLGYQPKSSTSPR
jgi:uncharacterized membrane protein